MKQRIFLWIAKTQLPKAARHASIFLATWLGLNGETDLVSIFVALVMLVGATVWSWISKGRPISEEAYGVVRVVAESVARHIVAIIAGFLAARGITDAGDSLTLEAIILAVGNFYLSASTRPDKKIIIQE